MSDDAIVVERSSMEAAHVADMKVYEDMAQGFAEHRRLFLDRIDELSRQVDQRFDAVDQRFDAVDRRFEAQQLDSTARFDTLEQKLDAFATAQAVVNQRLLEGLEAQAAVSGRILARLGG